jgi:sporulation protein YlmC with PRC-barrel domain
MQASPFFYQASDGRDTPEMEEDMLKTHLAAGLAAAALMTSAALAQTTPAPAPTPSGSTASAAGQFVTQMSPDMMRGSKLMGVDVYGSDNQKIGDIDEVLVDKEGKIHAVVVGIGGFLGIGEKDVAIPFGQLQWMNEPPRTATTSPAGGVTTPANPSGTATSSNQPATTGSTGAAGSTASGSDDGVPDRAMVRMSKADLQNAPQFRYSANDAPATGGAAGTNPPASTTPPGTAPKQ